MLCQNICFLPMAVISEPQSVTPFTPGKSRQRLNLKKIDFETEASDEGAAQTNLKAYLEENTDALKEFTGNTGFSAVIESIFR